jgi:hypothetical protein
MFDGLREKITIWWIDNLLGGYKGKEEFREDEIYLLSSEIPYAGMALASFHVAMNEKFIEKDNEKILEMVYLHEKQHLRDHVLSVLTGLSELVVLSPLLLALNILFLFAVSLFSILSVYPASLSPDLLLKLISADLLISFSAIIFAQMGEIRAELNAYSELGYDGMSQAKEDMTEILPEPEYLNKLSILLTHPTLEMVERVHSFIRE